MKKLTFILLLTFLFSSCSLPNNSSNNSSQNLTPSPTIANIIPTIILPTNAPGDKDTILGLNTSKGQIVLKLYSEKAPNTVNNFINKANTGFYNGLTFHRVEPGFVIQGGDPKGNGTGGGKIINELNNVPFVRGSIGLARESSKMIYSNDSQFFVCLSNENCSHLNSKYVNFGEVILGMEIVDSIVKGDTIINIQTSTK